MKTFETTDSDLRHKLAKMTIAHLEETLQILFDVEASQELPLALDFANSRPPVLSFCWQP